MTTIFCCFCIVLENYLRISVAMNLRSLASEKVETFAYAKKFKFYAYYFWLLLTVARIFAVV